MPIERGGLRGRSSEQGTQRALDDLRRRLSSLGAVFVSSKEADLRIVRGVVNTASTTPVQGEGFTITINGVGDVSITFDEPFGAPPAVVATPNGNGDYTAHTRGSILEGSTRVNCRLAGVLAAAVFAFTATGPA